MSIYFSIFGKYASIKLFHAKPALFGSADVVNVCNLHCTHCYWWLNRKSDGELDYLSRETVLVANGIKGNNINLDLTPQ
jgi:Fe-coproporphyrin III synthase